VTFVLKSIAILEVFFTLSLGIAALVSKVRKS